MLAENVSKLVDILMKHKIKGVEAEIQGHGAQSATESNAAMTFQSLGSGSLEFTALGQAAADTAAEAAGFNEMWQKYIDDAVNFDTTDWDHIFGELDSLSATKGWA